MNGELDLADLLIKLAIAATFIVFAACMWLLKKDIAKRKQKQQQDKDGG